MKKNKDKIKKATVEKKLKERHNLIGSRNTWLSFRCHRDGTTRKEQEEGSGNKIIFE